MTTSSNSTISPCLRQPVDLAEQFGNRYRIEREESYHAQYGPNARINDPWLKIIPCQRGHIYPHGGDVLAASVVGRRKVASQLRRLPCCRVHQDGDDGELTVLFDVADFAQVAKIIRPRRRRQVSAAERERLKGMGFKKKGPQTHVDGELTPRPCVPGPLGDSEVVSEPNEPRMGLQFLLAVELGGQT